MNSRSRLEYYRRFVGFSRAELSERSGVNSVMIAKYERCEKDLKMAAYITVKALADALGVSADELIKPLEREEEKDAVKEEG